MRWCQVSYQVFSVSQALPAYSVPVFLRLLEYYEGILFLTTNRIQVFDPAFKSRIHLAIKYPPLNKRHRQTLWKSLLARAIVGELPPVVTDLELASLKDKGLNGRQVKNVVRIASTLASNHGIPVNVTHLRSALKVMQTFDRDFENPRSENRGNIQQSKVIVQDSDSEAPNSVDVSDDVEATDSDYTDSVDCGGSGPEAEEESKAEDRSDGEAMVRPTKRVRLW